MKLLIHDNDFLKDKIQGWKGNRPIFKKRAVNIIFLCVSDRWFISILLENIDIRIIREEIDWNRNRIIVFSFFPSFSRRRINPVRLISIINQIKNQDSTIKATKLGAIRVVSTTSLIIKKISLSMDYESISLLSLSYFIIEKL